MEPCGHVVHEKSIPVVLNILNSLWDSELTITG